MKRAFTAVFAALLVLALVSCDGPIATQQPTEPPTAPPTEAATPQPTPTPEPTPEPTPTPEPEPTPEAPDSAGANGLLFDIYRSWARADLNQDGVEEDIRFTAGADKSTLQINDASFEVAKPGLAQLFAVTDMDDGDKILELVFTDAYDAELADSEKAYSWMYFWNGTKLVPMGGLMDVKFDGAWRGSFKAKDFTDGDGEVMALTRSDELTDVWYVAYYHTAGSNRKLYEWRHPAEPVNEVGQLTCKTVCVIFTGHEEVDNKRDVVVYMNSMYDFYWLPTEAPTTLGRVLNPDEGIKIIAQPGDKLTVIATYGPTWFKVKTQDNITGWIYCKDGKVGLYNTLLGWTVEDMFDGLVVAG